MDVVPGSRSVDVWSIWLNTPAPVNHDYRNLLSPIEIERADRFVFEHLTRSYELSHGALRMLLAQTLNCRAREVEFTYGPRGKPFLKGDSRTKFNMAHSGSLALYAVTADVEIGVDVEEMREVPDMEQIAARYFCDAEAADLKAVGGGKPAMEAFFRCWTRKEAYIKAVGDGLYIPLDQFQVTLSPDEPARFVHISHDAGVAARWALQHLDPASNYIGALAYEDDPRSVHFHQPLTPEQLLVRIGNICGF
jgi:4'-phosphopantetheinyl transferase